MTNDEVPAGLRDIEERVRRARERNESTGWKKPPGQSAEEGQRGMLSLAFRIGTELVAALIIGLGGGLLVDHWLGTKPWGLLVMFFLGAGAGVTNIYRAVGGLGYAPGYWGNKKGVGAMSAVGEPGVADPGDEKGR